MSHRSYSERAVIVRNSVQVARQQAGLSQRALARNSGVTPLILRRIERNTGYEPSLSVARRICEVLGRTDLFWFELIESPSVLEAAS